MSRSHPAPARPAAGRFDPQVALLDRRGFLTTAGRASIAALLAGACGGGDAEPTGVGEPLPPGVLPAGITREGSTLRVDVDRVPTLRGTNGFVIVSTPAAVILHLGSNEFRAFTARCPHAGCLVGSVTGAGIVCPCHGSTFDRRNGRVLVGPALEGLREFPVAFDAATRQLSVSTT